MTSRSLSHAGRTGRVVSCRSQVQTYVNDTKRSEIGIAKAEGRREKCNLGKATAPSTEENVI